jgi:hypothetical protein
MRVFVHTIHKAGSTFLHRYFKEMASLVGCEYFSINNHPPNESEWAARGGDCIVGPLRIVDEITKVPAESINVVHLRDPIDVLISQYFSFGWTHTLNSRNADFLAKRREVIRSKSLDQYCIEDHAEVLKKFEIIRDGLGQLPNVVRSSYSGMHGSFAKWNADMVAAVVGRADDTITKALRSRFAREFGLMGRILSFRDTHRRDGRCGQKERYLKRETIVCLDRQMLAAATLFESFECMGK